MKIPVTELVARLRSAPIDYAAAQLMEAAANRIADLEAENAGLLLANRDCMDHFNQLKADYDGLLAAPVAQEPHHFSDWNYCTTCGRHADDALALGVGCRKVQPAPAQGERQPVAWMMADGASAITRRCKEDGQHRAEAWVNGYTVPLYE